MPLIALEEHYALDPASSDNVVGSWLRDNNIDAYRRLYDRGEIRLQQMDAAGIDFQILSLFDPGVQDETDVVRAIDLAKRANDDPAETIRQTPRRFGAFATLPTQVPDAAAAESSVRSPISDLSAGSSMAIPRGATSMTRPTRDFSSGHRRSMRRSICIRRRRTQR
jgi:hypothetical protein